MAGHVVFDRRQARRRIERHRHAARKQHAVERVQILPAGRQHDRDHLARLQSGARELRRIAHRAIPQRAIAQRVFLVFLVHEHGEAVGLAFDVVLECLGQRARLGVRGGAHALALNEACDTAVGRLRRVSCACEQKAQQVARCLGSGQRLLGQARAEFLFEAQHQFDARKAVEAELLFERAVERDVRFDVRARFLCHGCDDFEHALGFDLVVCLVHRRFPRLC